jgi:NAD(P)-dependent dehydrogenase (short-subunit alcohol dehydrogenase family)
MMSEKKFEGKVVLITGGSSGIGFATAQEFSREGADVVITGRDEKTLSSSQRQLGARVVAIKADASRVADTQNLVEAVGRRFGRVDILVLNAGIPKYSPIGAITEEMFDETFNINVKGVFFTMQKSLPLLTQGAAVILVSSAIAHIGLPNSSVYAASKAAVISLARTFSGELMERGIRVNVVSPGVVNTPMLQRFGIPPDELDRFTENLRAQVPAKRFADPKEIARTVLFLASSDSSYIFGSEIIADGGMSLF